MSKLLSSETMRFCLSVVGILIVVVLRIIVNSNPAMAYDIGWIDANYPGGHQAAARLDQSDYDVLYCGGGTIYRRCVDTHNQYLIQTWISAGGVPATTQIVITPNAGDDGVTIPLQLNQLMFVASRLAARNGLDPASDCGAQDSSYVIGHNNVYDGPTGDWGYATCRAPALSLTSRRFSDMSTKVISGSGVSASISGWSNIITKYSVTSSWEPTRYFPFNPLDFNLTLSGLKSTNAGTITVRLSYNFKEVMGYHRNPTTDAYCFFGTSPVSPNYDPGQCTESATGSDDITIIIPWKFQGATDIQVNGGSWTGPGSVQYLNSAPSTTSANPTVTASVGDQLNWRIFLLGQHDSDSSANTALYSNVSHGGANEFDTAGFGGANPDTGKYADGSSVSNFTSADKYRINNPNLVKPTVGTGDHYSTSFGRYTVQADDAGKTLCEWGSWYWGGIE